MDFSSWQSGLAGLWSDARQFAAGVTFARPLLLWLSLLPLVIGIVGWVGGRLARRRVEALGRPSAIAALVTDRRGTGRLTRFALWLAWTSLTIGVAGPRWGKGDDGGVAVGRDVVVVIDLSRSMLAKDLRDVRPRWVAAVDATLDLIDTARTRGGHRIAVVVFAARAKLFVPLTTDYDHIASKLAELDAEWPPKDTRPADDNAKSGTRIGEGLKAAVEAHDLRFTGSQDIILLSDGDDPANDREWAQGVTVARRAGIPVHAVGIGDPDAATVVFYRGEALERDGGQFVESKLHEDLLKSLAAEGRGHYLPGRRETPALGEFFRTRIEPFPSRVLDDDSSPQPVDRSAWFFGGSVVVLVWWMWRRK